MEVQYKTHVVQFGNHDKMEDQNSWPAIILRERDAGDQELARVSRVDVPIQPIGVIWWDELSP